MVSLVATPRRPLLPADLGPGRILSYDFYRKMLLQPTLRGRGLTGSPRPSLGIKNADPDSLITGRDEGTREGGRRSALRVNWVLEMVSHQRWIKWGRSVDDEGKRNLISILLLIYLFAEEQNSHSSSLAAQYAISDRLNMLMLALVSKAIVQYPSDVLKLTCARARFFFHCLS